MKVNLIALPAEDGLGQHVKKEGPHCTVHLSVDACIGCPDIVLLKLG